MEDDTVEKLESVGETQLQGAFYNGTNEGLETGVGVGNLQPVARANDADREHAGSMDELDGSIHRIAADDLCCGMGPLPILDEIERSVLQWLSKSRYQILDAHYSSALTGKFARLQRVSRNRGARISYLDASFLD